MSPYFSRKIGSVTFSKKPLIVPTIPKPRELGGLLAPFSDSPKPLRAASRVHFPFSWSHRHSAILSARCTGWWRRGIMLILGREPG
jgi:hypothetical protein